MRAGACLIAGVAFAIAGCSESNQPASTTPPVPLPSATVYEDVRGRVASLKTPLADLQVTHERIADFANSSGETVGMNAMTMAMPLADDIDPDSFSVGDKIVFDLVVDWNSTPIWYITDVRPLAADTELDLPTVADDSDDE
ncbi:MAG: copper-binding protein [Planctomycetota bacterium]